MADAEHFPHDGLQPASLSEILPTATIHPITHNVLGAGFALKLPAETGVGMNFFPQLGKVLLHTGAVTVELGGVVHVGRRGGSLVLESDSPTEHLSVELSATGDISLRRRSGPAAEEFAAEPGEQARVTLRGRVGREPRFRTTKDHGTLVAEFPLGVHDDEGNTTWHSIVVFGERAAKVHEKALTTGQEIEVVGYEHETKRRGRDGQLRREVRAAALRTTLKKPPTA